MSPRILLLTVVASIVVACGRGEPPAEPLPPSLAVAGDTTVGTGSAAELSQWQARWRATRAGRDYRFRLVRSCFCVEDVRRPVIVRVSGDAVIEVRDAATRAVRPLDQWGGWPSIETLFAQAIEQAKAGTPRPVTYAAAGYPVSITIGPVEVDGGSWWYVSEVAFAE